MTAAAAAKRGFLRDNGLSIVLLLLFAASLTGHALAGWGAENQDRIEHGRAAIGMLAFLAGGEFLATLFENWESEFLQMWAYIMLTAYLFQRGSPESKAPDSDAPQDRDPAAASSPRAPWPVRAGQPWRALYSHSLGLAMLLLFVLSFALHLINSARQQNEQALMHGQAPKSVWGVLTGPQFWFESFQNWQSEFLATALLVILAIFLRERGSPESKPVAESHAKTGT